MENLADVSPTKEILNQSIMVMAGQECTVTLKTAWDVQMVQMIVAGFSLAVHLQENS
jgi:hypothetical protein